MKKYQLIMENWRRFLKEEEGQIPFEEIQQIFDTYKDIVFLQIGSKDYDLEYIRKHVETLTS